LWIGSNWRCRSDRGLVGVKPLSLSNEGGGAGDPMREKCDALRATQMKKGQDAMKRGLPGQARGGKTKA